MICVFICAVWGPCADSGSGYLLRVLLGTPLTGRRVPDNLPGSPDLLICVGPQEGALVKIPHGQHILLVLPVQGLTGGGTNRARENQGPFPTFRRPRPRRHYPLLVLHEVLRVEQFGQMLLLALEDLLGHKRDLGELAGVHLEEI